ncbi:MAG TPA: thermonuclease family protein [Candidatus Saccharimonadales bacterium]|nr:thermonuclease family protein [Candidatus Saccharimonadales bacterium]
MKFHCRKSLNLAIFILLLILIVITQSGWLASPARTVNQSQPGFYSISHFIDGDTIAVNMNGQIETIRMIGVDTPETHRPNTPVQCFGPEAASYTKSLIGDNRVRLQADPLDTNRDRYGRLLRYVYLPDGTMVEDKLISQGYGFAYLDFPFSQKARFASEQSAAQVKRAGLWGKCKPIVNDYGGWTSNPAYQTN